MAGYLRENDTNLCKSKWYNCNIHFHLKSIFQGGNRNQYGLNGKHLAGKSKERCSACRKRNDCEETWPILLQKERHTPSPPSHTPVRRLSRKQGLFSLSKFNPRRRETQSATDVLGWSLCHKSSEGDAWLGKYHWWQWQEKQPSCKTFCSVSR